jgi:DNA modification methylase
MVAPMKKVINKYHIWDARKIVKLLPDEEFIGTTITSPPYWNLKDYGVKSQIGFGQTYDRYLDDLEKVFQDIYTMTTKRGSLWIISDTIKHKGEIKLLPFDIAKRLERVGWKLQDIIIWNKDKTLPWSHRGKLRNIFEYITFYSKGCKFNYHLARTRKITELKEWWVRYPERYNPKGKAPARTWYIPIPRQGSWGNNWVRHFNPLPPELVERILLLTTDERDVVLDPFCGSGVVLAQASVMGRKYIGLDLNRSYRKMFKQRVLPAICKFHKKSVARVQEIQKNKKMFGKLILSLRKTKYPKELVRLYRRAHGPVKLETILTLQGSETNRLDITFLFPRKSQVSQDFIPRVKELSKQPPLSKYGIEAVLVACPVDVASQLLKDKSLSLGKRMYLYTGGRTYSWAERPTIEGWLKFNENVPRSDYYKQRYPPILSNIGVRVNPRSPFLPAEVGV